MAAIILQSAYKTFSNLVQYKPIIVNGGLEVTYPQVLYNGVVYEYRAFGTAVTPATNPITYKTPNTDASATALYTLGGGGATNVLGTTLTGFAPASGVPSASSTILQAFNYLSFNSFAFIKMSGTVTANGPVLLTGVTSTASSDITITNPNINIPLGKVFQMSVTLVVTSGASSGCNFLLGGNNANVVSNQFAVGASATNQLIVLSGLVQTTAASPSVNVQASGFTGTVSFSAASNFQIWEV
jgi:hypothetical protein